MNIKNVRKYSYVNLTLESIRLGIYELRRYNILKIVDCSFQDMVNKYINKNKIAYHTK